MLKNCAYSYYFSFKVVYTSYRIYFKFTKIGSSSGSTKNLCVLNYR